MPPISSPSIPTSFVPKAPVRPGKHFNSGGGNIFLFISSLILGLAILSSIAVFALDQYLANARVAKAAQVEAAEKAVNIEAIEDFIHVRDRFKTAQSILDGHVATSRLFKILESATLQNVRFNSMSLTIADDRTAEIQMDGVAKTFNALAAESKVMATEKYITRAIFSGITVNDNKTVSFSLTATIDEKLLAFTVAPVVAPTLPAQVSTSTVATSTASTTIPVTVTPTASTTVPTAVPATAPQATPAPAPAPVPVVVPAGTPTL